MIKFSLIETDEALAGKCQELGSQEKIAVDLEADSMHHYKEKICLIQVADENGPFLIDPLAVSDVSPLKIILENPSVIKVFHGADFDIRSLDRDYSIRVRNLFDTEIACRFLGIQQRGLASLLKTYFNVDSDKRLQKTDWSKRPLTQDMITYGLTDVAYLLELHDRLKKNLEENHRLAWATEEFKIQEKVKFKNNREDPLFLKFKGAGKMGRKNLAVLENLLQMRKSYSKKKDKPPFKILNSEAISRLTHERPGTMAQLRHLRILSPKQVDMYGEACLTAISDGLDTSAEDLPFYPRKKPPIVGPEVPEKVKALKQMRESASDRTGIEPGFLINNAIITAIATAAPKNEHELKTIDTIRSWQIEILGKEIIEIINKR